MKKLTTLLILFLSLSLAKADDNDIKAENALIASGVMDQINLFFEDIKSKTGEHYDPSLMEISEKKLLQEFIQLYSETYSIEELDGITIFFNSNAGKAALANRAELSKKTQEIWLRFYSEALKK